MTSIDRARNELRQLTPHATNADPSTWPAVTSGLSTRTCSRCGGLFHCAPTAPWTICVPCVRAPAPFEVGVAVQDMLKRRGIGYFTAYGHRHGSQYAVTVTRPCDEDDPGDEWTLTDHSWRTLMRKASAFFHESSATRRYWQARRRAWALADERAAIEADGGKA